MPDFARNEAVVCEDGREVVIDRKHNGVEPGPSGEYYAVRFGAALEWLPAASLQDAAAVSNATWLAERAAAAASRSAKAAVDNVAAVEA